MKHLRYKLSVISLVMIILVMTAGSIVRTTGSGMGCPDWPKCFGYMIPPTSIETLTWNEGRQFDKGNIIIRNESLLVAKAAHTSGAEFESGLWEPYTKHDYAHFDPVHTWIEFINRLIGVLAGIPVLLLFILSALKFRSDLITAIASTFGLILLGFEAWLGKLVVDGNLIPHSITYHLFGAIALVLVYVFLTVRLRSFNMAFAPLRNSRVLWAGLTALLLLIIQIGMGTAVREQVDAIEQAGLTDRSLWTEALNIFFKVHRSFSILVLAGMATFAVMVVHTRTISSWPRVVLVLVVLEIVAGMCLAYLGFPPALQPVHLIGAVLLFASGTYVLLTYVKITRRPAVAADSVIGQTTPM